MVRLRRAARARGRKVVFTNGVFDLLHVGHVRYLAAARALGDLLVVGLNSDASAHRLKGPRRPLTPSRERAEMLLALRCVNYVVVFNEDTPHKLIKALTPDVLVKGADWATDKIVGHDIVKAAGGRVARIRLTKGRSTTRIIKRIVQRYKSTPLTLPSPPGGGRGNKGERG